MRVRFPSRNIEAVSCPSFSIFDGSQDWVIAHNDVVAGSSPASGSKCRSSSVVEHVIPSSSLIRRSFQRAVDCGLSELLVGGSNPPFASAEVAQSDRAAVNIHHRSLPALSSLMGRRHRVICHWFDSNPGRQNASVAKWYSNSQRRPLPIVLFVAASAAMIQPQPSTTEAVWQTTHMIGKNPILKSPASDAKASRPKRR